MLSKFSVVNASWKGVLVPEAEAELHTAVVDENTCSFQIRWFTTVDGVREEVNNIVSEVGIDHSQPLLTQLNTAFTTSFPQAVEI